MSDDEAAGRRLRLSVPSMDCTSCADTVERSVSDIDGVHEIDPRPTTGWVTVTYDPARTTDQHVIDAIEDAGYAVEDGDDAVASQHDIWRSRRAIITWIGAVFLVIGLALEFLVPAADVVVATALGRELSVSWLAYVTAAVVAGGPVVRGGYYSARARSLDIDLLMGIGVVGALLVDLPFEAATLAVLFSIAELLERFSMDRARRSMRELLELSPDTATVIRDGEETVVPVEDVGVGERVAVRPGEKVPTDGIVRGGACAVDESPITGESVPVDKAAGDEVYAGSIVEDGYLEVEATARAEDSTLAAVIRLVEEAGAGDTRYERFIDRFAGYYTPIIVVGAVLTLLLSPTVFGVTWEEAFVRGLTLLVVACPCAFVISTPVSVVSGITAAARNGVLVKAGSVLEAAGEVETVAFDKTGTLTTGELAVTDTIAFTEDEEAFLATVHALERRSEHPIARAVVAYAEERDVPDPTIRDFEAIPGKGVRADVGGETYYAGTPALFADLGVDLGHAHVATDGGLDAGLRECDHGGYLDLAGGAVPDLQAEGKTVVLVGTPDAIVGVVAVADTLRPEADRAIARLHDLGIRTVMLTGDNERTARAIADRAGIDGIRAGLLPGEKVEAVEALKASGPVAMVGDGVNDAPALAAADVGIAMGAAGTDTAIETADVALMGDDLTRLPYLHRLARRTGRVIRENVWSSLAVKAALAIGAPLGLVSVVVAIVVGDMGMSLGVTTNALRLAGLAPDE